MTPERAITLVILVALAIFVIWVVARVMGLA
jgi:hypothetical protein